MSLLELYIDRCKSPRAISTDSKRYEPYLFAFTENFRNILKIEEGFETYLKLCSHAAGDLNGDVELNPERAKSFIANINRTKLFVSREGRRVPSAKGEVYEKFLLEKMSRDERWFINYLTIADSYFELEPNYIFAQTRRVFDKWLSTGYSIAQIYNSLIYLFNIHEGSKEEYLRSEYLVLISFINDPDFLRAYRASDDFERSELHDYIVDNFSKERFGCIVSEKFAPTSLTDCDTVLDDAKLLFFSHYLMNSHPISLEDLTDKFAQVYMRFYKINARKISNFVMMYEDVFGMIYLNLFAESQDFYLDMNIDTGALADTYERLESSVRAIDYTTTESINMLAKINSVLSIGAKSDSGYKCELEDENGCRYFTSHETGRPYLEVHQLIPRGYAGEFDMPIERPSNYIAMCPHCHSLIHKASDAERFKALAAIYAKRKARLDADGITPSNELLFAIYGIEQSKLPGANFYNVRLEKPQPKLAVGTGKKTADSAHKKTTKKSKGV